MPARLRMAGGAIRVRGRVVTGRQLGRTLGVPTANIALMGCPVALHGSYAARVGAAGRAYPALAHLGVRPSVGGGTPLLEVHLFDYDGNLYGQRIAVCLLHKVSTEVRLPTLAALARKIRTDLRAVRRFFIAPPPRGLLRERPPRRPQPRAQQ